MNVNIKNVMGMGTCYLSALMLACSCNPSADYDEQFSGGVTNAQLESPQIDETCFSTITNSDGSESVKLTWPVVFGAGGYNCNINIVNDPDNPVGVVTDSIVDGCSIVFDKLEDTKYEIKLLSLGNSELNNKEAKTATSYAYSTLIPATTIPVGQDIAEFINNNLKNDGSEQAFELVGGASYTMNGSVDFDLNKMTVRGDMSNHPTVTMGADAYFMTQAGLKVQWINFDCTSMTSTGLITLSGNPSETISTETLGYKKDGANQNGYVINDPVIIQECHIKNLQNSLLYGNKKNWSLRDFRIKNCIAQLNNAGSNPFIHLQGASNGLIKNMTIENSTFYNLVKNSSAYFIRYSNQSNAQPKKIFGDSDNSTTHVISHCTFAKTFSNKDFANNMPNTNTVKTTVEYCIFYDVFRLYQYIQTQSYMLTPGNTIFGVDGGTPNSTDTGGRKDKLGNPYATLEDPDFVGPFLQEFDLTQDKGGVNFKPQGEVAVSNKSGDPRWYE
jgi:hypothetical protein